MRILIVDDHEAVRLGLRDVLSHEPGWQVCGEAANGEEAVNKVRDLTPDVVILDIVMPSKNGLEATAQIRQVSPFTRIVFFSMHNVPDTARLAGGDVFVSKAAPLSELLDALGHVA